MAGWWFGICFFLLFHFFPSYWECHHPESQLTKSIMFQRGRSTTNQMGIQGIYHFWTSQYDVHSHDPIGSLIQAHYSL